MSAFEPELFESKSRAAVEDASLKAALDRFRARTMGGRALAAEKLEEFEALRDAARDIKNDALVRLGDLLIQFEQAVEARGGHVHWARDAPEARAIIVGLCQAAQARRIVKSKSMVSEEIDLVPALEAAGMKALETDLGEYIIQLRHERPSHLIGPALHLTKDKVADTFRDNHASLDPKRNLSEPKSLVAEARAMLREDFATAEVGITGANFLIAETGSVVVVTNEGNADLSAGLPRTHIVLTGIEKVIPSLEDAALLIRVLARSAIGQEITAYTSLFTGPRQSGETTGPTAFHVVLLDNGRSAMLGTPLHEALRCIRCGACLNHCPVFGAIGGHAYGSIYSGPIGAVLTPAFAGLEASHHLPNASTLCGRCEEVCPVRIPIPAMLRHWREQAFASRAIQSQGKAPLKLWTFVASRPGLYALAAPIARSALSLIGKLQGRGWIRALPGLAGGWTKERDMRVGTGPSFQHAWRRRSKP